MQTTWFAEVFEDSVHVVDLLHIELDLYHFRLTVSHNAETAELSDYFRDSPVLLAVLERGGKQLEIELELRFVLSGLEAKSTRKVLWYLAAFICTQERTGIWGYWRVALRVGWCP